MKPLRHALIAILFAAGSAFAAPANDASIRELLDVTQAQKVVESMRSQFDGMLSATIRQSLQGKTPSAREQKAIDNMKNRMLALMQRELAWDRLEPMYLQLYRDAFSEEEVAGMLGFYRSPTGRAVIEKMPGLMQRTMLEVQKQMMGLAPELEKIQRQFVEEFKASGTAEPAKK